MRWRASISYSAGTFICNNTMYALLDYIHINRLPMVFIGEFLRKAGLGNCSHAFGRGGISTKVQDKVRSPDGGCKSGFPIKYS
ncbi:hypothetical protein [Paenibacillus mangrovi]|uniref:pyroglutamyl-peptidase I family protein n=1 Tax=Paenibacillus mangrovi TaxID=2931978 RepID=UPI003CC7C7D7